MSGGSASSDKDSLMDRIGTHGIFQLRVILIVQFVGVFAGWQILVSRLNTFICLEYS